MQYKDALEYIHGLQKFGSQPGLERITSLCEELGNPQDELKFIHVTGTNGKGSVCQMFYQTLCQSGYNTGLFISPYIVSFRERMQANGEFIKEEEFAEITNKVKLANDSLALQGIFPTEFETLTAIAFLFYKNKNCDLVVLEAGMGGRHDSTNIIKNTVLSVIVSIGLDHVDYLGNTLEEIAYEKAGIIKSAPAIIPKMQENLTCIFRKEAEKNNSDLFIADKKYFSIIKDDVFGMSVNYKGKVANINLVGEKQAENLNLFFCGIKVLQKKYKIKSQNIIDGLSSINNPGRFEIISENPMIILDGAHNSAAAENLSRSIKKYLSDKKLCIITGVMADKDYNTFASILAPLSDKIYAVNVSNNRALDSKSYAEVLSKYNKNTVAFDNFNDVVENLICNDENFDAYLVTGSFYLISDIRKSKNINNNIEKLQFKFSNQR